MKYTTLALLGIVTLFITGGCDKKDDTQTLQVTFKALFDNAPLVTNQYYNYAATNQIQFTRFSTYLSDLQLVDQEGDVVTLSDIEFVDFTPDFRTDEKAVDVAMTFEVPARQYKTLKIGYGVKKELNAKRPSDYDQNHPLFKETEYWSGWRSYIFNKIEGTGKYLPTDPIDGIFLVYHCGSDKVYRNYEFGVDLNLSSAPANLEVAMDLKPLFFNNNEWLDLSNPDNHITSNEAADVRVANILMDRFDDATKVK
jgi:hypothetical protein